MTNRKTVNGISGEIWMGLMNLHDAFLNASLQRKHMLASPIEKENSPFDVSDRGRFERTWVSFLYVLVEAWHSDAMKEIKKEVSFVTSIHEVEILIDQAKKNGHLQKMANTRHYMCHRDKRRYWDEGRSGIFGGLNFHNKLHMAFSTMLLESIKKLKPEN